LVGRALDSWAEQISKEHLEDIEREAKKMENVSIQEKNIILIIRTIMEDGLALKTSLALKSCCYEEYLEGMKEKM